MKNWIIRKKSTGEEKSVTAPTREAALASLIENLFDVVEQTDLFGEPAGQLSTNRPPLPEYVTARWAMLKERFPNVVGIRVLSRARSVMIASRAKAAAGAGQDAYAVWDEIFDRIARNYFLTGRAPPGKDRTSPFGLTIEYVLRDKEFSKILEGGYPDDETGNHGRSQRFDPNTGRLFGPTEQGMRGFVEDRGHRAGRRSERRGVIALGGRT